jgi:DNA-binding transcriptional ArsR family regulator
MEAGSDVFAAIAAPVRRDIIGLLHGKEMPVSTLADSFDMTLSAVSQHLAVLRDAGLVSVRKEGKQRLYKAETAPLKQVMDWVDRYTAFWPERLAELGAFLDEKQSQPDPNTAPDHATENP